MLCSTLSDTPLLLYVLCAAVLLQGSVFFLNFTAGGFIYVATVDVLPSLLLQPSTATQIIGELLAFFAGVGMMIVVTVIEVYVGAAH